MKISTSLLLLISVFFISIAAFGQPVEPDAPTPFGFVELLMGAGAVYGASRTYKRRIK